MTKKNSNNRRIYFQLDPQVKAMAKDFARAEGISFSEFVRRALEEALKDAQWAKNLKESLARGECQSCGYAPCGCDNQ